MQDDEEDRELQYRLRRPLTRREVFESRLTWGIIVFFVVTFFVMMFHPHRWWWSD